MLSSDRDEERKLVEWFSNSGTQLPRIPQRLPDGSFALVFPSEVSRMEQLEHCQDTVSQNCTLGGRSACSINALKYCQPSWVESLFSKGKINEKDIIKCEDEYMIKCLQKVADDCRIHSNYFCARIFAPPA